jgi:hypothetical protein
MATFPVTAPATVRAPVPAAAYELVDRAARGLAAAQAARSPGDRYVSAHLAALRCAAAVLAVRGRPSRRGPMNVWAVLPRVAPELTEWAAFFAAGASRRAAVEAGRPEAVTVREADDLLRDAQTFARLVAGLLGISSQPVLAC